MTATLVVWKLDRLSRRGIGQVGQLLDQFEQAKGRLVSVMDGLDTQQPQARMIIALLSEFARAESETMGVRIKSAKEAQRARGEWLSGKPPFGYAIAADRKLVPVEPAASAVREAFEMIIDGHGLKQIARHRSSRGGLWRDSALSESLRSPAYAGLTPARHVDERGYHAAGMPNIYRDKVTGEPVSCLTPGAEPIVPRAIQLAAQRAMLTRLQKYGRGNVPRRPAYALLLRGLGRCAGCDRALVTHGCYRCPGLDRVGNIACLAPATATIDVVDRTVAAAWGRLLTSDSQGGEALRQTVARRWLEKDIDGATKPTEIRAEIAELHARLDDADHALHVRSTLDSRRHATVTASLQEQVDMLEFELARQPLTDTRRLLLDEFVKRRWEAESPDARRALVMMAWSRITVEKAARSGDRFDEARLTYVSVVR